MKSVKVLLEIIISSERLYESPFDTKPTIYDHGAWSHSRHMKANKQVMQNAGNI